MPTPQSRLRAGSLAASPTKFFNVTTTSEISRDSLAAGRHADTR